MYFERAYFLAPGPGGTRPYRLLASAMEETGRAGVATFVMRGREYLVAIIAEDGILRAETCAFTTSCARRRTRSTAAEPRRPWPGGRAGEGDGPD